MRTRLVRFAAASAATLLLAAGCGGDAGEEQASDQSNPAGSTDTFSWSVPDDIEPIGVLDENVVGIDGCDAVQEAHCALPFPSNAYTVEDPATDSGRRVGFRAENMTANSSGVRVDPTEWNRNDGFSPGSPLLVSMPGADLSSSGAAPITDLSVSVAETSPIVIVDAVTGALHPHWAELDANTDDPAKQLLIIRPATNFTEGHRLVVGIRDLVDTEGTPFEPSPAFRAYRDRLDTGDDLLEAQRRRMEENFAILDAAGVERTDLQIAWDFTVASERNLTERMLHLRDDAFSDLGDDAPNFEVTGTEPKPDDDDVAFYVDGTFEVPLYLTGEGEAGSSFDLGDDGLPQRNTEHETFTAQFRCAIPEAAIAAGAGPARPVLYGHGLLGSVREVGARNIREIAHAHNLIYCATPWIGMSEGDITNAIAVLGEVSRFHTLADRSQQGMLNALFLGRLMIHADGLSDDPAFQVDGEPILSTEGLVYDGNSQGGIMGGALTAVAQDWTRSVLGVTGMNYSTLLRRSKDFDIYSEVIEPAYPDALDQTLGFALIQMLWDRAEVNGYAHHLTDDPLPGTPVHQVLLHVAFGDFQVADVSAFVEARTAGARYSSPLLGDGRGEIDYTYGLDAMSPEGWDGSAIVMWDSAVPSPPLQNTPPRGTGDPQGVHDPHEDPRLVRRAMDQKVAFWQDGIIVDVCDGEPCTAERSN